AAEEGVLEQQQRLDDRRDEIHGLEEGIQQTRERRDAVRTEIEEHRIAHAALRQDGEHLALTFHEQFEKPLPAAEDAPGEAPSDLAELEAELARTKAALERLGPVNLLAVQ